MVIYCLSLSYSGYLLLLFFFLFIFFLINNTKKKYQAPTNLQLSIDITCMSNNHVYDRIIRLHDVVLGTLCVDDEEDDGD